MAQSRRQTLTHGFRLNFWTVVSKVLNDGLLSIQVPVSILAKIELGVWGRSEPPQSGVRGGAPKVQALW